MAWDKKSPNVIVADIVHRMKTQFLPEQQSLVRASFVFGLACLASYDTGLESWLLERVSGLQNLEQLYLAGTLVSDRCLDSFAKLPKLRYVYLPRTQVTSVAATRFMESRPGCRLSY